MNVDFADYALPPEASVLFFFHPYRIRVLSEVVAGIQRSLLCHFIAYVAPTSEQEHLFASAGFLEKIVDSSDFKFCVYKANDRNHQSETVKRAVADL